MKLGIRLALTPFLCWGCSSQTDRPVEQVTADVGSSADADAVADLEDVDTGGDSELDVMADATDSDRDAVEVDAVDPDASVPDSWTPDSWSDPEVPLELTDIPCDSDYFACCHEDRVVAAGQACQVSGFDGLMSTREGGPLVEYRCGLGAVEIEARYAYPGCDGTRPSCSVANEDLVWGAWESFAACDCTVYNGVAVCLEPSADASSSCLTDGEVTSAGRSCGGAIVNVCSDDEIHSAFLRSCDPLGRCVDGVAVSDAEIFTGGTERSGDTTRLGCGEDGDAGCVSTTATVRQFQGVDGVHAWCGEVPGMAARCDPTEECCNSAGRYELRREACGTPQPVDSSDQICLGREIVQRQWTTGFCEPTSNGRSVCRTERTELPAITLQDCALSGEVCDDSTGTPRCIAFASICEDGACCDEVRHTIRPEGSECGGATTEYPSCASDTVLQTVRWERGCDGRSAECGGTHTVLAEETCPDGTYCYSGEGGLGCHPAAALCEPDGVCCLGYGTPAVDHVCGDILGTRTYCDPGSSRRYIEESTHQTCGEDLRCNSSGTSRSWLTCPRGTLCVSAPDGTGECVTPPPIPPPPCTSGSCCDRDSGQVMEAGTPCTDLIAGVERRCSLDGRKVLSRTVTRTCDGENVRCTGDFGETAFGTWRIEETCDRFDACTADDGPVRCAALDRSCESGACCFDGLMADTGVPCEFEDGTRETRTDQYCGTSSVHERTYAYACSGFSSECPESSAYSSLLEDRRTRMCAYGCERTLHGADCLDAPPPADPPAGAPPRDCGTPCMLDARTGRADRCWSGQACSESGYCIPASCAFCSPSDCSYFAEECEFDFCVGDEGESGGGDGGTCPDRPCQGAVGTVSMGPRTVNGVEMNSAEMQYEFFNSFGVLTVTGRFRYETTNPAHRMPHNTIAYLIVRGPDCAPRYVSFRNDGVPTASGEWSYSIPHPHDWGGMFCDSPSIGASCIGEEQSHALIRDLCVYGLTFSPG